MIKFTATILKFDKQGEKTGCTYIEIRTALAQDLYPGNKKSFRIKEKLEDDFFAPTNTTNSNLFFIQQKKFIETTFNELS